MTDTKGFFLPDPVGGYPIKTICLEIPDAPEYIRAFWGHFQMLGKWWLWEHQKHTGDTRAKEAAEYWRPIILDNMQRFYAGEVCAVPFDVRQNEESPCTLEKSIDDGETWIAWANLRLCAPRLRRFNPVTGVYEESLDDGATWNEAPNPLNQGNFRNPPLAGPDAKCDAAYNARVYLAGLVDSIQAGIDATSALASIAGVIAGAIGLVTGGAALPGAFLLEGISAVFYAGSSAISLAFTEEFYTDLQCIFYCNSDDDGQFNAEQHAAVIADLNEIGGLAGTFMSLAVQVAGADGLSNMGTVSGGASGDCSDCECYVSCATYGLAAPATDSGNTRTLTLEWDTVLGEEYTITVTGFVTLAVLVGAHSLDACYRQFNPGDPWEEATSDYFFAINGESMAGEKPFSAEHIYVFTMTGDGNPLEFSIYDIGALTDNTGSLTIEVCGVGIPE